MSWIGSESKEAWGCSWCGFMKCSERSMYQTRTRLGDKPFVGKRGSTGWTITTSASRHAVVLRHSHGGAASEGSAKEPLRMESKSQRSD